jgi:plasmid stabilization system protein ParE
MNNVSVGIFAIMFYWIDEIEKRVTIARVIYALRDYEKLL